MEIKDYKIKGYTIPELMNLKKQKEAELEAIKKKLRELVLRLK